MIIGSGGLALFALMSALLLALAAIATARLHSGPTLPTGTRDVAAANSIALPFPNAAVAATHEGLVARLSHDLRTPLNAIIGFAELMKAETFGPLGHDHYRAYVSHMQGCGLELLHATENTIAMASLLTGPAHGRGDLIDLSALVEDSWLAATSARTNCTFYLHIDLPSDLQVVGNFPALRQSFINLLGQACDRCPPTGKIEVASGRAHGRVDVWINVTGGNKLAAAARTGCRARTSSEPSLDELAISVSRTLLGMHGVPLVETSNHPGNWAITMSLEDAAQADFFDLQGRAPRPSAVSITAAAKRPDYLTAGLFGGAAAPLSRSA